MRYRGFHRSSPYYFIIDHNTNAVPAPPFGVRARFAGYSIVIEFWHLY